MNPGCHGRLVACCLPPQPDGPGRPGRLGPGPRLRGAFVTGFDEAETSLKETGKAQVLRKHDAGVPTRPHGLPVLR